MMIRMVGGWVFLLVPAHPGSPGQTAIKRLLLCCCVSVSDWRQLLRYCFCQQFTRTTTTRSMITMSEVRSVRLFVHLTARTTAASVSVLLTCDVLITARTHFMMVMMIIFHDLPVWLLVRNLMFFDSCVILNINMYVTDEDMLQWHTLLMWQWILAFFVKLCIRWNSFISSNICVKGNVGPSLRSPMVSEESMRPVDDFQCFLFRSCFHAGWQKGCEETSATYPQWLSCAPAE